MAKRRTGGQGSAEASLCTFFVALDSRVYSCPKISRNVFLKKFFQDSFCNQPVLFA